MQHIINIFKKSFLLIIIIHLLVIKSLFAQDFKTIKAYEDSIVSYSNLIIQERDDDKKLELNKALSVFVEKAIRQESSIDYAFKKLNFVSVLTSDNKKFRVISWTLKMHNEQWKYFGFTQSLVKSTKSYKYSKLKDQTSKLRRPDSKTLNAKKWLGAYYYKIIETRNGSKYYYTLLGWKGYDRAKSMKVIEIATIRSNGDVIFGYPLFNIRAYKYFKNKRPRRLVFTFSGQVKMFLDYDIQSIHIQKKSKKKRSYKKTKGFSPQSSDASQKVKVKTITKLMIVMDRLEPTNLQMEGFYEFYFPETNVVDALLFKDGKWNYYPDVDARNKATEQKNIKPKKEINYNLY